MLIGKAAKGLKMDVSVQPGDLWKLVSWRRRFGKCSLEDGWGGGSRENMGLSKCGILSPEWGLAYASGVVRAQKVSVVRKEGRKQTINNTHNKLEKIILYVRKHQVL